MRATFVSEPTDLVSPAKQPVFPKTQVLEAPSSNAGLYPKIAGLPTSKVGPREAGYRITANLILGDLLVAIFAIFIGLSLREEHRIGWSHFFQERPTLQPSLILWSTCGGVFFLWLMMFSRSYEIKNLYRVQRTLKNVAKSALLWAFAVWACVGLFNINGFSPRLGAAYCVFTLVLSFALWRLIAFSYIIQPRIKQAACSRTVVVGWNAQASHLRSAMKMDLGQLGEMIGCVPLPGGRFAERPPADLAVLGDYSALPALVKECGANAIILADISCSSSEIRHLISFAQRELLTFQLVPQYFPALNSGLQIQTVSGVPLLGVNQLPLDRTLNRAIKRSIDVVGSLIGLLVCATIVPFFCAIVYLESPGPVIFKQRRTSRFGRDFHIYKIRSMRLNAETSTGAVWCKQEDPRRLKIGGFMRKTNIDELPQFFNVLKGDMSLVGPRPERPELIAKFKNEIANYNARHEVRAGLTGWAQINGLRGDTDLTKRIEADLYYLENWSVFMDMYCIIGTFFKRKNAY